MTKMRKNFALLMVAILSLTIALAVASCGKKAEESSTTTTEQTTPPTTTADTSSMMAHDSTATDTMAH
jgi:ABC-type oligopeptide transport system substrate-binding subunit